MSFITTLSVFSSSIRIIVCHRHSFVAFSNLVVSFSGFPQTITESFSRSVILLPLYKFNSRRKKKLALYFFVIFFLFFSCIESFFRYFFKRCRYECVCAIVFFFSFSYARAWNFIFLPKTLISDNENFNGVLNNSIFSLLSSGRLMFKVITICFQSCTGLVSIVFHSSRPHSFYSLARCVFFCKCVFRLDSFHSFSDHSFSR